MREAFRNPKADGKLRYGRGTFDYGMGAYGDKKVNDGKLDVYVVICRSKDKTE